MTVTRLLALVALALSLVIAFTTEPTLLVIALVVLCVAMIA